MKGKIFTVTLIVFAGDCPTLRSFIPLWLIFRCYSVYFCVSVLLSSWNFHPKMAAFQSFASWASILFGINQALPTKRSRWKRLSSRDQWNLTPATMQLCSARCMKQMLWSSAEHALAQMWPRKIFTRTFSKKWSQMRPFWAQSRALKCSLGEHKRLLSKTLKSYRPQTIEP